MGDNLMVKSVAVAVVSGKREMQLVESGVISGLWVIRLVGSEMMLET
jgi:hypothetical protein